MIILLKEQYFLFFVASSGLLLSILGIILVNLFIKKSDNVEPQKVLDFGTYITSFFQAIAVIILSKIILGSFKPALIAILGMMVGILIGVVTEYYTSKNL